MEFGPVFLKKVGSGRAECRKVSELTNYAAVWFVF